MFNPIKLWKSFLARSNDDRVKIFGMATLVALICSLVVSSAHIILNPLQLAHLETEKQTRISAMLDKLPAMKELLAETGADNLETRFINLTTGTFEQPIEPDNGAEKTIAIPTDIDIAGLKNRNIYAQVHFLQRDGKLLLILLPVSGSGYQSTIHAMLALEADLKTIAALTIIEQGETPGLGTRIEEPEWLALWPGKQTTNEAGEIVISVVRGQATSPYEVDGISGATRTGNGIANMLRYWLGPHGYGPFLERLEQEGI